MSVVQQPVSVEQNSLQVGQALAQFTTDLKAALGRGLPFIEAIAVAQAVLNDIVPVLSQVKSVPSDFKDNPGAELMTAAVVGQLIYQAIVS